MPRSTLDADLTAAIADAADHVTLLEARDLYCEVGVDSAASCFDVHVRVGRFRKPDGDAAGACFDLEMLDRREELQLRTAAASVDIDTRGANATESNAA